MQAADRFIPNRSASQFELAHHLMTSRASNDDVEDEQVPFSTQEMRRVIKDTISGDQANAKILAYQQKPPSAPEGMYHSDPLEVFIIYGTELVLICFPFLPKGIRVT